MYLNRRSLWKTLAFSALSLSFIISCAKKNDQNHAPVCPYGQVLVYDGANYSCRYVNFNANGYGQYGQGQYGQYGQGYGYNQQYNPQQQQPVPQPGVNAAYETPPVPNCQIGNQVLVKWISNWLCYPNDVIYPSGGNSPVGQIPPPGRGGEFCTAVGVSGMYGNSGYGNPGYNQQYVGYNQNYQQNYGNYNTTGYNVVGCSPGFVCQASNAAQPSVTPTPYNGYDQQYGYNNNYGNYTQYGYGQSGTCQYMGYNMGNRGY